MKRMAIEELDENVKALVATAPRELVLLIQKGKPFAFVRDASLYDEEDIGYISDPAFWKMIAKRRKEPTISFAEVKRRLEKRELALTGLKTKSSRPRGDRKH